jgi:hypothetical protein
VRVLDKRGSLPQIYATFSHIDLSIFEIEIWNIEVIFGDRVVKASVSLAR